MEPERLDRWVYASHGLARVDQWAVVVAQSLGKLDCRLIVEDERIAAELAKKLAPDRLLAFDEQTTMSYLWVLGAYELVRTLDQRCRQAPGGIPVSVARSLTAMKHRIERLRMPLAKLEPARRHPDDSPIAYPAISFAYGIAWQVDSAVFISRRELAGELLLTLEAVRVLGDADVQQAAPADAVS